MDRAGGAPLDIRSQEPTRHREQVYHGGTRSGFWPHLGFCAQGYESERQQKQVVWANLIQSYRVARLTPKSKHLAIGCALLVNRTVSVCESTPPHNGLLQSPGIGA